MFIREKNPFHSIEMRMHACDNLFTEFDATNLKQQKHHLFFSILKKQHFYILLLFWYLWP